MRGVQAEGAESVFVELGEGAGGTAQAGAETGKLGEVGWGGHVRVDVYTSNLVATNSEKVGVDEEHRQQCLWQRTDLARWAQRSARRQGED